MEVKTEVPSDKESMQLNSVVEVDYGLMDVETKNIDLLQLTGFADESASKSKQLKIKGEPAPKP